MTHDDEPLLRGIAGAARRKGLFEKSEDEVSEQLRQPLNEAFVSSTVDKLAHLVESERQDKVIPLQTRRSRRTFPLAGTLAAIGVAAAAAFALTTVTKPAFPPLPIYRMELVSGGVAQTRGSEAMPDKRPVVYGTMLEIVARPQEAVEGPLEARAFALDGRGRSTQLPVLPQVSPGGAVRLLGMVGKDLNLPSGTSAVWIAIGRPGSLPSAEDLSELLSGNLAADDFVVLGQPVLVQ